PADSGKYVLCLRRQRDGAWRVVADMWNATPSSDDLDTDDGGDPRTSVTRAAARRTTEKSMISNVSSKYIALARRRR
ncbi:MAG TPA: hypothetical protein VFY20_02535, partial [Gemmatimonadales bacterium]|nr:hypothetical protein [Gemmatimonadales bacterium]